MRNPYPTLLEEAVDSFRSGNMTFRKAGRPIYTVLRDNLAVFSHKRFEAAVAEMVDGDMLDICEEFVGPQYGIYCRVLLAELTAAELGVS